MSERVEPPAEHRGVRWHWLAMRGRPAVALWEDGVWWFVGEAKCRTPDFLVRHGFRYLAPCLPPEEPRDGE